MITEIEFKFCPACGAHFSKIDNNLLVCRACDLHHYLNPKATNAILLQNEKDEYLFVRRSFEPKKGWLDLPGGFLNQGETVEESLIREVLEELGIILTEYKYELSYADEYEFKNLKSKVICLIYSGKLPPNSILKPADDVSECVFFKKEDIPFDKLAFDGIKFAVNKILFLSNK
jgi:ADP-ribose pyrophosphatase YjhB (NUDIX family)